MQLEWNNYGVDWDLKNKGSGTLMTMLYKEMSKSWDTCIWVLTEVSNSGMPYIIWLSKDVGWYFTWL